MAITACTGESNGNTSVSTNDKEKPTLSLGTLSEEKVSADTKLPTQSERVLEAMEPNEEIAIVVRVDKENYVPDSITPTVKITPYLFTARLLPAQLELLKDDEHVKSIEISQKLQGQ